MVTITMIILYMGAIYIETVFPFESGVYSIFFIMKGRCPS